MNPINAYNRYKEYLLPKEQKAHGHIQGGERPEDYEACILLLSIIPSVLLACTFCSTEQYSLVYRGINSNCKLSQMDLHSEQWD